MKRMHRIAAAGVVCLVLAAALWAATYRFDPDGPTGDWSDNDAWDRGSPPGPTDDAIIMKDKTVTVDAPDREVMELWLKDDANVDLESDVCATDRLLVYRESTVSGQVTINAPGEAGAREICAAEVRVAELAILTVGSDAAVRTIGACTCPE